MRYSPPKVTYRVDFPEEGRTSIVGPGTTILAAAQRVGVHIECVCGGEGNCGKCRVMVEKGRVRLRTNSSTEGAEVEKGTVLACMAEILSDVQVKTPKTSRIDEISLIADFQNRETGPVSSWYFRKPLCRKQYLELTAPSLSDNLSDFERVQQALSATLGKPVRAGLGCIRSVPEVLRGSDFRITATYAFRDDGYELLRLEGGDASRKNYGIAVDIGTTTVMANLVDLYSGKVSASSAVYNSQIKFGADVITRIMHAQENREGLENLHQLIIQDINRLIGRLAVQAEISTDAIASLVCSGNTIMIHFLLGITPENIRREPYIPAIGHPPAVHAEEIGIAIHPRGYVGFLPGFGSYVGSDITAAVLASGLAHSESISLLIDVGTNGEVVLGCKDWLICCSASAGPAFEGAGTNCGVRATPGAIEKVRIQKNGNVQIGIVVGSNNHKPIGICGSGYIDLVAELFTAGFIDRTGRFKPEIHNSNIRQGENGLEFVLVKKNNTINDKDIVITEADIITLIRTKGSIFTAAEAIIQHVGLSWTDIEDVFISGGFGNHLDMDRSIVIGLLPDLDRKKFHFIGNGSLVGAQMCLLSEEALIQSKELAHTMTYFDLSTDPLFMNEYSSSLFLPHTDLKKFPTVA